MKNKKNKSWARVEKSVLVETKVVETAAGPTALRLVAEGGQIGLGELTGTGATTFVPPQRVRTHRIRDKSGRFRWYNDYRLPDEHGGATVTVRLHGNDDGTARRFNRTENVRAIAPGDPDFDRLYPRCNDAESINRHLDDTMWLRRAHTVGHERQTLNLLTYALGINAFAVQLHRARSSPVAA